MNDKIRIAIESLGLKLEETIKKAEITGLSDEEILEGLAKVYRLKISGFTPKHSHRLIWLACQHHWQGPAGPPHALRVALGIVSSYLANRGDKW